MGKRCGLDDIIRCPECSYPVCQGHQWRCSLATLEQKVAGAEKEIEGYWKPQLERYRVRVERSHAAIAGFHGRYMMVKAENNALRRKLYRQKPEKEQARVPVHSAE